MNFTQFYLKKNIIMSKTTNCNIYKERPDVYCGRGRKHLNDPFQCGANDYGVFGNPVAINFPCPICDLRHTEGGSTLPCYEKYLIDRLANDNSFREAFLELKGKKLGCYCKPGPCHTDVMIKYLDSVAEPKTKKFYAGIGARKTPPEILAKMTSIARTLESLGYSLRSGGAIGADQAFEAGSDNKEIFKAQNAHKEAFNLSSGYHPAWEKLDSYVQALHARNAMIVLGYDLDSPVDFVICWTPKGKVTGGTGQALRIALDRNIPIYNIAIPEDLEKLRNHCRSLIKQYPQLEPRNHI